MTRSVASPELHELRPREQAGAATGERYEFQYHQAAADALNVLDDTKVSCIYCEWHDDYVIEAAGAVSYRFHQVKTRSASQGPWTTNEFFGVQRVRGRQPKNGPPRVATASNDSIFGRLYEHRKQFGDRCDHFVFVTDAGCTDKFESLLKGIQSASEFPKLDPDTANEFAALHSSLVTAFSDLTQQDLFLFLQRLYVREAMGRLGDLRSCRTLIGGRILDMSEVDLTISESQKIGADLVAAVRERSHRVLNQLPVSTMDLRLAKGLVLDDVLKILSLSSAGYRALKIGGRPAVVALSRLHRLCQRSGVEDALVPDLCRFKTAWEAWWIAQRHIVNGLDQLALKKECAGALQLHAHGTLSLKALREEAAALAKKFSPVFTSTEPLTDELVFGLMLSLAVEAEQ